MHGCCLVLPKFSSELMQRTGTDRTEPKVQFSPVPVLQFWLQFGSRFEPVQNRSKISLEVQIKACKTAYGCTNFWFEQFPFQAGPRDFGVLNDWSSPNMGILYQFRVFLHWCLQKALEQRNLNINYMLQLVLRGKIYVVRIFQNFQWFGSSNRF